MNSKGVSFSDNGGASLRATGFYHFELVYQGRCFMLRSPLVGDVAVLNEQTGQTLKALQESCSVSYEAYSSLNQWNKLGQSTKKVGKDLYVLLDINVYGFKNARTAVGQYLSSKQTYLQHPSYQDESTLYDNPHFLQIPGIMPDKETLDTRALEDEVVKEDGEKSRVSTQIKIDETVTAVFESLTRLNCLKGVEADSRVRTTLLP